MQTLKDKVAIVTGAAGGVGRGIALALANAGARVAIPDIKSADDLIAQLGDDTAFAKICDIRDSSQVNAFVDEVVARFGTVDILVNNAMASALLPLIETSDKDIELAMSTGPMATLYFMRSCYPHLVDGGRIINLRSGSEVTAIPNFVTYIAAKSAIAGITRAAAREWGRSGITVNAICPFVLSDAAAAEFEKHPGQLDNILTNLSIPRVGHAENDIGRAVVYLAGPDGSYVTGTTLSVDGGAAFMA
ncbi:SDR family oxidoreductase [Nocardia sp. NEAU-G5]|uniref:SDR family oxidoreductase n=1 Tax=Nocardia albiluteola TaxID=2842303 RepID=A0ABS6AY48_9NOCA|nr:SDR family oxidoreductase [Nocardia albiluteola]MBU3062445.1 SDR family oxidoreductase [Nocardia albiluteola]